MSIYYPKTLRIISFITLIAFITTQTVLGYDSRPASTQSQNSHMRIKQLADDNSTYEVESSAAANMNSSANSGHEPQGFMASGQCAERKAALMHWLKESGIRQERTASNRTINIAGHRLFMPSFYKWHSDRVIIYKNQAGSADIVAIVDKGNPGNFIVLECRDGEIYSVESGRHLAVASYIKPSGSGRKIPLHDLSKCADFNRFDEAIDKEITKTLSADGRLHTVGMGSSVFTFWLKTPVDFIGMQTRRAYISRNDSARYPVILRPRDGFETRIQFYESKGDKFTVSGINWAADGSPVVFSGRYFNLSVILEFIKRGMLDGISADPGLYDVFDFILNTKGINFYNHMRTYELDEQKQIVASPDSVYAGELFDSASGAAANMNSSANSGGQEGTVAEQDFKTVPAQPPVQPVAAQGLRNISGRAYVLNDPSQTIREKGWLQLLAEQLQAFYSSFGKIVSPPTARIIMAPIEAILNAGESFIKTSPTKIAIALPLNISINAVPSAFLRVLVKYISLIDRNLPHTLSFVNRILFKAEERKTVLRSEFASSGGAGRTADMAGDNSTYEVEPGAAANMNSSANSGGQEGTVARQGSNAVPAQMEQARRIEAARALDLAREQNLEKLVVVIDDAQFAQRLREQRIEVREAKDEIEAQELKQQYQSGYFVIILNPAVHTIQLQGLPPVKIKGDVKQSLEKLLEIEYDA